MDQLLSLMLKRAEAVKANSYSPYSKFPVGACLESDQGDLFVGTNVENCAYPQSVCAESNAVGAMVAAGQRRIRQIVIVSNSAEPCYPCGGCLQRLAEFGDGETLVHLAKEHLILKTHRLADILPFRFSPEHIKEIA